jgi:hypothetical protein
MQRLTFCIRDGMIQYELEGVMHEHEYGAGSSDDVSVFGDGHDAFLMSRNVGMGYCGLEVYVDGDKHIGREVFIQNADEDLGDNWDDLEDAQLLDLLLEYVT